MALSWRSYTAPVPFVVDGDYQVPYYALYFEEIMHNINVAEETFDLQKTTWYRYLSKTQREPFTPLQNGEQELVGYYPRYSDYVLEIRAALVDLWQHMGTTKARVLQSRFGYSNWAHPQGYDTEKQEFSDRDIEELRFHLPSIGVSLMFRSQWISARGDGYAELPDEYGEAEEEEQEQMVTAAIEAAWAEARQNSWDKYLVTRTYAFYTGPAERLERWWGARIYKQGSTFHVTATVHLWGPAVYILFTNIPDYLQGKNYLFGKLTYLARVVGEHPVPVRLWAHVESYDHQPDIVDLRGVLDGTPNLGRGPEQVGNGWTQVTVCFELTDAEEHILIGLGLDSPIAFAQSPFPIGSPFGMEEGEWEGPTLLVVGPQAHLNEYSFDFECFMFGRSWTS